MVKPKKPEPKKGKQKESKSDTQIARTGTFDAQVAKLGYRISRVAGDGNCLFRSLSDQLYGTSDKHLEVRKSCVAYIRAHLYVPITPITIVSSDINSPVRPSPTHRDDFAGFILGDAESYCCRMESTSC